MHSGVLALLPLAIILAAAAPHAEARRAPSPAAVAAALNDPAVQQIAALQIASLAGIVLDTKVGPLASLADPADHVRADDTLRDVVRRRDPDAERHLYESSRRAVAAVGAVAGEAAELQRTADRLRVALAPLTAALNGQRDR